MALDLFISNLFCSELKSGRGNNRLINEAEVIMP